MSAAVSAASRPVSGAAGQHEPPPRFRAPRWSSVLVLAVMLGLSVQGLLRMDISWSRAMQGPSNVWDFFMNSVPPNVGRFENLALLMLETLEIALIGTIIGVVLSLPAALIAARNTTPWLPLAWLMRLVLTTLRSVPDLVWALIFVIEEIERGPMDAVRSTGASSVAVVVGAVLPAAFASFTATSLYCLEKSIRGATILGMVGAGGIGMELTPAFNLRQYDTALMIILLILVVVLAAEQLSSAVRKRMLGADQLTRAM